MTERDLRTFLQRTAGLVEIPVRPTRWQLAAARLILLARGRKGRLPLGLLSFCIGVAVSVGAFQLLSFVPRYGLIPVLAVSWIPILRALGIFAAGGAALLGAALYSGDDLSRRELEAGALIRFNCKGISTTVPGATHFFDWEHVRVRESVLGILIELPRGAFHLLPRDVVLLPLARDV